MSHLTRLATEFERRYGAPPERIARAPGRVNLIGEHTDYNDGFVLPIAIDRHVLIAARPRADHRVRVTALDVADGQQDEFALDDIGRHPAYQWANYVRGVAFYLGQRLKLVGLDAVITATLPAGAGLSSSAALEMCTAFALHGFARGALDRVTLAQLCQRAEADFVGVKTGIMDQYASALGEQDKALLIDCRALQYRAVRLPSAVSIVVADTNKKRQLAASNYNTRRLECENAVQELSAILKQEFRALRDVSLRDLARAKKRLPENLYKRARHVITENRRVQQAARAARRNDPVTLGALLNESQTSLRDDYEASSPELDVMVELARRQPGCYGSRLTGAGWGGATVNLVQTAAANRFVAAVTRAYRAATGIEPWVAPVRAAPGAGWLESVKEM
ncbi:MAG: Galactokinase [Anaerolineae bacterium]|nr:Galactokinase [Anaerolineae bacterium]